MSSAKKALLVGRLSKRLKHFDFHSFAQYYQHVTQNENEAERQVMVNLLTTNETYFFREPGHFDFVRELAARHRGHKPFRVWSAASSSGEEAYSLAMVLADTLGDAPWDIIGTDISTHVLDKARLGHYSLTRTSGIPIRLLKKYCLKGLGEHAGTLLINKTLRDRVRFLQSNLLEPCKGLEPFDLIFLRNVMIYFNDEVKRKVIANLLPYLKNDGYLVVGHSESLNGLSDALQPWRPTIYRRAGIPLKANPPDRA